MVNKSSRFRKKEAQTSFIAGVFRIATHDKVVFENESLIIHKPFRKIHIDKIQDFKIETGIIWDALAITLKDSSERVLIDGFSSSDIKEFYDYFDSQFSESYYSYHYELVKSVLALLPNRNSYFKQYIFNNAREAAKNKLNNFEFRNRMPSSVEQNIGFELMQRLLGGDSKIIEQHNENFISSELKKYKEFFDSIESNPLTEAQRLAVIKNETSNLVIAGAGSGKTSVIAARCTYIVDKFKTNGNNILVLSFNASTAEEIKERLAKLPGCENIHASTFHALGLKIIANATGEKPSLAKWEESGSHLLKKYLWKKLVENCSDVIYQSRFFEFLSHPPTDNSDLDFSNEIEFAKYMKSNQLAFSRDKVKSLEELIIANFLYLNGVKFEYEAPYKFNTASEEYRQYTPDFYLSDYDIYLEHYGVGRNMQTAPWINSEKYAKGMEWKRSIHEQHGTKCLETYSYMKQEGDFHKSLKKLLEENGVQLQPIPIEDAIENLKEYAQYDKTDPLVKIITTFINHFRSNRHTFAKLKNNPNLTERSKAFLDIVEPLYYQYEAHKQEEGVIDFNDMIELAIEHVKSKNYKSPFKFLLVDEFQDISISRAELVRELLHQNIENTLTAVGDDWQSINRFAGSDISLFTNFDKHFGYFTTTKLDYTFRYNNQLASASKRFIEENPFQIKKEIKTIRQSKDKEIYIHWQVSDYKKLIHRILTKISIQKHNASVMILVRYNFQKLDSLKLLQNEFKSLTISEYTAHASKGLEADYVIVIGLDGDLFGFPSEIEDDPVIELVLAELEGIEFAEERRLFYVALTRAKNSVHLINNQSTPSRFLVEMSEKNYPEVKHVTPHFFNPRPCPSCLTGVMFLRNGKNGLFLGCTNHKDGCSHTEKILSCEKCSQGIMIHKDNKENYKCSQEPCDYRAPACEACGACMVLRKSKHGLFWGCSNYGSSKNKCSHIKKYTSAIQ
jgi:DNA helicase-4